MSNSTQKLSNETIEPQGEPSPSIPPSEFEMEVFRAGDYGAKGVWTEGDLDAIAQDYDPATHEAPLTLDHAQSGPAYGWVSHLRRVGDRLLATVGGVSAGVARLIREGAYKKRSVELSRRSDAGAGAGARPYLKAVSLLGAAVPEVKGLRPIAFGAEDKPAQTIAFDEGHAMSEKPSVELLLREVTRLRARMFTHDVCRAGVAMSDDDQTALTRVFCSLSENVPASADGGSCPPVSGAVWLADFLGKLGGTRATCAARPQPVMSEIANESAAAFAETAPACIEGVNADLDRVALSLQHRDPQLDYVAALRRAAIAS